MAHPDCPLLNLEKGDIAVNSYVTGFLVTFFRLNCRHCDSGYLDFLESDAQMMPDTENDKRPRYQAIIETIIGVKECGKK